jgi:hypothetical protein
VGSDSVEDLQNKRVAVDPTYLLGKLSLAQTLASRSVITPPDDWLRPEHRDCRSPWCHAVQADVCRAGRTGASTLPGWSSRTFPRPSRPSAPAGSPMRHGFAIRAAAIRVHGDGVVGQAVPGHRRRVRGRLQKAQSLATRNPGTVRTILPSYAKITEVTAALVGVGNFRISNNAARLQRIVDLMTRYRMLTGT